MDVVGSGEKQGRERAEPGRAERWRAPELSLGWLHSPQDGTRLEEIP